MDKYLQSRHREFEKLTNEYTQFKMDSEIEVKLLKDQVKSSAEVTINLEDEINFLKKQID
jgi:hypothetical protein